MTEALLSIPEGMRGYLRFMQYVCLDKDGKFLAGFPNMDGVTNYADFAWKGEGIEGVDHIYVYEPKNLPEPGTLPSRETADAFFTMGRQWKAT